MRDAAKPSLSIKKINQLLSIFLNVPHQNGFAQVSKYSIINCLVVIPLTHFLLIVCHLKRFFFYFHERPIIHPPYFLISSRFHFAHERPVFVVLFSDLSASCSYSVPSPASTFQFNDFLSCFNCPFSSRFFSVCHGFSSACHGFLARFSCPNESAMFSELVIVTQHITYVYKNRNGVEERNTISESSLIFFLRYHVMASVNSRLRALGGPHMWEVNFMHF